MANPSPSDSDKRQEIISSLGSTLHETEKSSLASTAAKQDNDFYKRKWKNIDTLLSWNWEKALQHILRIVLFIFVLVVIWESGQFLKEVVLGVAENDYELPEQVLVALIIAVCLKVVGVLFFIAKFLFNTTDSALINEFHKIKQGGKGQEDDGEILDIVDKIVKGKLPGASLSLTVGSDKKGD
jgi:hypothetical protein